MDEVAQMNNQSLLTGHLDRLHGRAFTVHQANKVGVDSGTVNGVKFTLDEVPDAKVMNALDEVSRLFADRVTKPIGGHQIGERLTAEQQYFTAVDSWKKIFPEMPGDAQIEGRLRELRQQVRDNTLVINADLLLRIVAEMSAGPGVSYAVLQSMKAMLDPGEVALSALIDEALATLMRTSGRQILTEVNIHEAVNKAATSPADLQKLRDLYKSEVDGFTTPQECYKSLVKERGALRLWESLDFLTESLGQDLQSQLPSRDKEMLGDILTQLKQASILRTVCEELSQLVSRMSKGYGERPAQSPEELTGVLLQMVQSGAATKETVAAFLDQMGIRGLAARNYCCREFQGLVRRMSSDAFAKESDRIGFVDASQDLMDDMVAELEEGEDGDRA